MRHAVPVSAGSGVRTSAAEGRVRAFALLAACAFCAGGEGVRASEAIERQDLAGGLCREKLTFSGWDPSDPVPAIAVYPRGGRGLPLVILCHWFQGCKEAMEGWARELAGRGFFALAIDLHLHGERAVAGIFARPDLPALGAEYSVFVHQSAIAHSARDVPLIIDALATRPEIDCARIGVAGFSMGASLAMVLAWQEPRVTAVAALAGACDFWWDVTKEPPGPAQAEKRRAYGGRVARLVDSIDPWTRMDRIAPRAVFLASGTRDHFIAIESPRAFARALRPRYAACPERFTFLEEDAGHEATETMRAQANAWLARWLLAAEVPSDAVCLRAGAHAQDITPAAFPVIICGGFLEASADKAHDRLHARSLVLERGSTRIAIAIVDTCVMPRELIDEAKALAHAATGISPARMLIAATHTHTAPSAMACLGSDRDEPYARKLPALIAAGIEAAARNLVPARAGWMTVDAPEHTHCRRWILRPDKMRADPFGAVTVRATMHPGYQNPDFVGPAGPVDPALSILAVARLDGAPLAVLANYSMHYFGSQAVSADYYGAFADALARRIGAGGAETPLVVMMSQGTSGDLHWMDYGRPQRNVARDAYAEELARIAFDAYRMIRYRTDVPLDMVEETMTLARRVPDEARLAWARPIAAAVAGRKPRDLPEVYAREQLMLAAEPSRELKLQALRIGDLGIAALPCEVFGITGLRIKAQSPFERTIVMALSNGEEGYIPPPAQHRLGGYTTWPARTAALEVGAEPAIVEATLGLFEKLAGAPRRSLAVPRGRFADAVLAARPRAFLRLEEFEGPRAEDCSGNGTHGAFEGGIAFHLEGAPGAGSMDGARINRAVHLAGGRVIVPSDALGETFSIVLWFWNGLPATARPVTGHILSFARDDGAAAEHVGIGGTGGTAGRLFFAGETPLAGTTEIELGTWRHVVLVRDRRRIAVHLDGRPAPEISGESAPPGRPVRIAVGGDGEASFEGKVDEIALFDRALTPPEIEALYDAAR